VDGQGAPSLRATSRCCRSTRTSTACAPARHLDGYRPARRSAQNEQLNWLDGQVLDFGKELKIMMGPSTAREQMFSGKLSALELSMAQGRTPEVELLRRG
jgi:hypothetical protein